MSARPWRLIVTPRAERDLNRLPEKVAAAVLEALAAIEQEPERLGKPLTRDLEGVLSARRGPYRLLYTLERRHRRVYVVAIAHRADVYRRR